MNPNELETAEGRLRFSLLQTMCRAVVSKSAWIGTLSNWALGTTAVYVSLMIANLDKIEPHLHGEWICPVIWLAVVSAAVGIGIQLFSSWAQIAMEIENQVATHALDALFHPERYGIDRKPDHATTFGPQIMIPVREEFIESRPWAFRELATYGK